MNCRQGAKSGLLDYFGLTDWFLSLPEDERTKFVNHCQEDIETLFEAQIYRTSNTAARFVVNTAYNIFSSKDHVLSSKLLQKAYELIRNKEDYDHCLTIANRISMERRYIPDQRDIDRYKYKVLAEIRNNPGIFQSEIKKLFSSSTETIVGHAISQLTNEGKINREKKGRSFKLFIVE